MKLYLSSIRIPTPNDLPKLLNKPLAETSVALIPNAEDRYSQRGRNHLVGGLVSYMELLGLKVAVVDLRNFNDSMALKKHLSHYDLMWAMGGNTFCLRYEMKRSGFDEAIEDLLTKGIVYGGDSAGALVAGRAINGIESADAPEFAEKVISEGLKLVPYIVLPHADNPEFADVVRTVRALHQDKGLIELNDSQAVIFDSGKHWVVEDDNRS